MALLSWAGGFQQRTCFVHDQGLWKQRDYRFRGLFQRRILTRFVYSQHQLLLQQQHNWVIRAGLMFKFTAAVFFFFIIFVIQGCSLEAPDISGARLQLTLRKFPPNVGKRHTFVFQGLWKAKTADSWWGDFSWSTKQKPRQGIVDYGMPVVKQPPMCKNVQ